MFVSRPKNWDPRFGIGGFLDTDGAWTIGLLVVRMTQAYDVLMALEITSEIYEIKPHKNRETFLNVEYLG